MILESFNIKFFGNRRDSEKFSLSKMDENFLKRMSVKILLPFESYHQITSSFDFLFAGKSLLFISQTIAMPSSSKFDYFLSISHR